MQKIKHGIITFIFGITTLFALVPSPTAAALPAPVTQFAACANGRVLTFPQWFRGLHQDPKTCAIQLTKLNDVWVIALNVLEMVLQITAYAAVIFIMWGGFKYMKSQGDPKKIAEAKSTILNAVIGLTVALAAVAIVVFVGGTIE